VQEGSFLLRESESSPGTFTFAVKTGGIIKNFRVEKVGGGVARRDVVGCRLMLPHFWLPCNLLCVAQLWYVAVRSARGLDFALCTLRWACRHALYLHYYV
jgi:hypothetical protein